MKSYCQDFLKGPGKYTQKWTGRLGLTKQIHHKINWFNGFDSGTKYTLATECGLVRGNPQFPRIL